MKEYTNTNEIIFSTADAIQTWIDVFAGYNSYLPEEKRMVEKLEKQEEDVEGFLPLIVLDSEDNKNFIDCIDRRDPVILWKEYQRLEQVTILLSHPHSKFYKDRKLTSFVLAALEKLYRNDYNEHSKIIGNWWQWEIGIPRCLNNILCLLYKKLPATDLDRYTRPIDLFVPSPFTMMATTPTPHSAKGGNQVDIAKVKMISALLQGKRDSFLEAVEALLTIFTIVEEGNGFYKDGSYVDHGNLAYTGGYGRVLIDGFSELLPLVTKYSAPLGQKEKEVLTFWIEDCFAPFLFKGELMDLVRGRGVSRHYETSHAMGGEILKSFMRLRKLPLPFKKMNLEAFVRSQFQEDTFFDHAKIMHSYSDLKEYLSLMNMEVTSELVPSRAFRKSSFLAFDQMKKYVYLHPSGEYAFALSLFSDKIQNYESINQENLFGQHQGEGFFFLYNKNLGHYSEGYWASMDEKYCPGTTILDNEKITEASGQRCLNSKFSGGSVLNDQMMACVFDFHDEAHTLSIQKSYIILDDRIIFRAAHLHLEDGLSAHTTIDSRRIKNPKQITIHCDGKELVLDIGQEITCPSVQELLWQEEDGELYRYHFMKAENLYIRLDKRLVSWKRINKLQYQDEEESAFYLTIYIKHNHPVEGSVFSYEYLPYGDDKTNLERVIETNGLLGIKIPQEDILVSVEPEDADSDRISDSSQLCLQDRDGKCFYK